MIRSIIEARVALAGLVGVAASGCALATVGEGAEASRAELTAGTAPEAGGPVACGARFVSPSGDGAARNPCRSLSRPCRTIQQAVTVACPGDLVLIGAGTFAENVIVDKAVSLLGAGESTVVVPAVSSPNPCSDSSLCGGAASSVFVVRASDVSIVALAIDGDNPSLTSGTVVRGVDVDARNGIVMDSATPLDGFEVRDVTVRNVYLRGIEASGGGTFVFEHDRVRNLSDDEQAVGIFNSGCAGRIEGNHVTESGAGIAANGSRGTRIALNAVVRSGAGIHTDNQGIGAGSTPDAVEENVVSDCVAGGYGLWSFAPYMPVTFRANRVSNCSIGLAEFGQGAPVESQFTENEVDGATQKGSLGLYITTSRMAYGATDVAIRARGNTIQNASIGIFIQQTDGETARAILEDNSLLDDQSPVVDDSAKVGGEAGTEDAAD